MKKIFVFLTLFLVLTSCSQQAAVNDDMLRIEKAEGYTHVTVMNPWRKGEVLQSYVLVDKNKELPSSLPDGVVVRTPLQKALVYSEVHATPIAELGCVNAIGSVCDAQYFKTPEIVEGLKTGKVVDCGTVTAPLVERIVSASPDAIILSPMENTGHGAIERLGVPIIEMADYMESSPLERARWIEFLGLLFGKEAEAEAIYQRVETEYNDLKSKVADVKERPVVLSETVMSGVWYVPGGQSYRANLFRDAGAEFPWSDDTSTGSLALDFPQVLDRAQNADCWLVTVWGYDLTRKSMLGLYAHNDKFKAFQEGNVYYVNSAVSRLFEETPFRPERLLKEYIKLFHPALLPDYQLVYYKKMGE